MLDLCVTNGKIVRPEGIIEADLGIQGGKIIQIGNVGAAAETLDAKGLYIFPGVIDSHVHFREPGLTHKEDLATGTLAAIAGGVTAIFEMPNTDPLTLGADQLNDKLNRAKGRAYCDHAFYIGGAAVNAEHLGALEILPGCCGVKVFMGSSTGDLLAAEDDVLEKIFRHGNRRVSLHAEDNDRLTARKSIVEKSGDVKDHPV